MATERRVLKQLPAGRGGPRVQLRGELRGEKAERFFAEAERRNRSPTQLATDLLETIAKDNLFAAVLDE